MSLTAVEICAGGGGQALGLDQAGFRHVALAEIDSDACITLRTNLCGTKIIEDDIRNLDGRQFRGVDLVAGGVPCQPFSVGSKQLGHADERDLFPEALRIIEEAQPRAVLLENVMGLGQKKFAGYRWQVAERLWKLGYAQSWWQGINACTFGVPQLRPRLVLVALRAPWCQRFHWPYTIVPGATAGEALYDLMAENGWPWAHHWSLLCNKVAPTIVGGSKKHGGPDLGPTRARAAWRELHVNGGSIAELAPGPDEPADHLPRLTLRMVARLQGFPDDWWFSGTKTAAYRQIGNAFPPPVARAFGREIKHALEGDPGHAVQNP
jgi:DNA (cytosine-5)-methyltransferase 1